MVSHSLLALFAVALIAASANAASSNEVDVDLFESDFEDEEIERGFKEWASEQLKEVAVKMAEQAMEYFKEETSGFNIDCVKEVFDSCKINPVFHPKKYYDCARNYVLEHKEHCYKPEEATTESN